MKGGNVQEYVDDMVVTSQQREQHVADLEELFTTIAKYRLKLNPEKCVFRVEAGKFLGFLLTKHGIEANPEKCVVIIAMTALSRFVSAGGDKGHPYFQCLKRNKRFVWTRECEEAFLKLKEYLASLPVLCEPQLGTPFRLYFAVTERAISSVLVQEQNQVQKSIYFVSKVLQGPEVRYQAIEKAALAIVFSAPRLRHYFQSFTVIVMTDLPIRKVYADFVVELSSAATHQEGAGFKWVLSVDGSSNQQGSWAGVILEGPNGLLIEQTLQFAFKASNNQIEYEALIAGMLLAKEMDVKGLLAKSGSLLVIGQVTGEYHAKDPQMVAYLEYVQILRETFEVFELVHVPREQNARADLLAKLASSGKGGRQRTVIQETLRTPRTTTDKSPADQHFGRGEEELSVVDSGDIKNAQNKHIPSC
ncbi:uncharacterized protein [Phaseolus vulgaris]|uniref:uncharacterized protein n=1 Tax=Phaseolus vulgaris TaxID=3885 RepID=UPI0035CC9708